MAKQRISYVPLEEMDADMRKEMERCQREGTPRPGELGDPSARSGLLLVLRELLARHLQERRARSRRQGAVPPIRIALGRMRILRQPALGQGDEQRRR